MRWPTLISAPVLTDHRAGPDRLFPTLNGPSRTSALWRNGESAHPDANQQQRDLTDWPHSRTGLHDRLPKRTIPVGPNNSTDHTLGMWLAYPTKFVAFSVAAIGGVVLLGWMFDQPMLQHIIPGDQGAMKPNSAIGFVLAGFSLASFRYEPLPSSVRFLAQASAIIVMLIGSATLSEYLLDRDVGIDQLLFRLSPDTVPAHLPERMASCSALGFLLIGASLLMLHRHSRPLLVRLLAATTALIGLWALLSYADGLQQEHLIGASLRLMAMITALTFLLLTSGTLLTSAVQGPNLFAGGHARTPAFFVSDIPEPPFVVAEAGPWDIFFLLGEVIDGAAVGHFSSEMRSFRSPGTRFLIRACCSAIMGRGWGIQLFIEPMNFVVARIGKTTVGAALISATPPAAGPEVTIDFLVVAHGSRRRGIGAALVRHVLANAPAEAAVHCHCTPQSQGMQCLLRRSGFVRARKPTLVRWGEGNCLMPSLWVLRRSTAKLGVQHNMEAAS